MSEVIKNCLKTVIDKLPNNLNKYQLDDLLEKVLAIKYPLSQNKSKELSEDDILKMMFENCNHFCHFISLLSRFYFSSIFLSFSFSPIISCSNLTLFFNI